MADLSANYKCKIPPRALARDPSVLSKLLFFQLLHISSRISPIVVQKAFHLISSVFLCLPTPHFQSKIQNFEFLIPPHPTFFRL